MSLAVVGLGSGGSVAAQEARRVEPIEVRPSAGDADTPFRLDLPDGASCPGDSANAGYRVNTYLIPASVDPLSVRYDGLGPAPWSMREGDDFRQPLFDTSTNSVSSLQTAEAEVLGDPGLILPLPDFSFAVYGDPPLPAGSYAVGVVCTQANEIASVWGTQLDISVTTDGGLAWRLSDEADPDATEGSPPWRLVALGGLAVVATSVFLVRRPRVRTTDSQLEN